MVARLPHIADTLPGSTRAQLTRVDAASQLLYYSFILVS